MREVVLEWKRRAGDVFAAKQTWKRGMAILVIRNGLRGWYRAKAYKAAEDGDYEEVHALQELFRRPFDEQPDKEARYYRKAPSGSDAQGGIGFMS